MIGVRRLWMRNRREEVVEAEEDQLGSLLLLLAEPVEVVVAVVAVVAVEAAMEEEWVGVHLSLEDCLLVEYRNSSRRDNL